MDVSLLVFINVHIHICIYKVRMSLVKDLSKRNNYWKVNIDVYTSFDNLFELRFQFWAMTNSINVYWEQWLQ
jgi:hypothetical protein